VIDLLGSPHETLQATENVQTPYDSARLDSGSTPISINERIVIILVLRAAQQTLVLRVHGLVLYLVPLECVLRILSLLGRLDGVRGILWMLVLIAFVQSVLVHIKMVFHDWTVLVDVIVVHQLRVVLHV